MCFGVWGQIVGLSRLHDRNVGSFGDGLGRMSFALQIDTFGPESTTFGINIPVQSSGRFAASNFRLGYAMSLPGYFGTELERNPLGMVSNLPVGHQWAF